MSWYLRIWATRWFPLRASLVAGAHTGKQGSAPSLVFRTRRVVAGQQLYPIQFRG
ncbi:hypothetical protein GCM10009525_50780 [Streptosporangium amethystogenes subsp. fukuiense]